ncbi:hypothetical protein TB1_026525 [Malus domestica]
MDSLLLKTYIKDSDEKHRLFHMIDIIPCVAKKAQWALRWIGGFEFFTERIVAFACVKRIVQNAVKNKREFMCDALPCALVRINRNPRSHPHPLTHRPLSFLPSLSCLASPNLLPCFLSPTTPRGANHPTPSPRPPSPTLPPAPPLL